MIISDLRTIEDNYYKWFQFKIIHQILGNRDLVTKIGNDDPICDLCQLEIETLQHLFFDCVYSNKFLTQSFDWLFTTANKV